MNYVLTLRQSDVPSELINLSSNHQVVEVRAWVSLIPQNRWVEVECLCGAISRDGGPEDYLTLVQTAWEALCGSREPVSA